MRFHDLRHTFGSHLIAAGVDLKTVSTLMGHSSISVTVDIYGLGALWFQPIAHTTPCSRPGSLLDDEATWWRPDIGC